MLGSSGADGGHELEATATDVSSIVIKHCSKFRPDADLSIQLTRAISKSCAISFLKLLCTFDTAGRIAMRAASPER
jgi:hypothetical protein